MQTTGCAAICRLALQHVPAWRPLSPSHTLLTPLPRPPPHLPLPAARLCSQVLKGHAVGQVGDMLEGLLLATAQKILLGEEGEEQRDG